MKKVLLIFLAILCVSFTYKNIYSIYENISYRETYYTYNFDKEELLKVANDYKSLYKNYPKTKYAPVSIYRRVCIFNNLYKRYRYPYYKNERTKALGLLIKNYPKSWVTNFAKRKFRQTISSKRYVVVIDPGHGGKDPGAVGYKGIKEKDIVLKIAREVKKKLSEMDIDAYLTRNTDIFIPLSKRAHIANNKGADVFISIHCNAHRNKKVRGISTWILNATSDKRAIEIAARENNVPVKKISDINKIILSLIQSAKLNISKKLAYYVQKDIVRELHGASQDLGVRQAPFYVLIDARMPSILVETLFVSNSRDAKLLSTKKYRTYITRGICQGIIKFLKEKDK
ncbi:MAG: N-acetylmuramoyl-L-alanine amidase [Deltaproteobacteria bacterium]|nr:N-acetylmuramoyl-L-alanine amidase [Deltaproteobacteria bacterium]